MKTLQEYKDQSAKNYYIHQNKKYYGAEKNNNQRNYEGIGNQNYANPPIIEQIRNKQLATIEQVSPAALKSQL